MSFEPAVAQQLAAAGRQREATDWARRGLDRFADRLWQTSSLRQFVTARLRASGDVKGAEALWWEAFERHPSLEGYRKVLAESAAGDREEEAVALLRQRLDAGDLEAETETPCSNGRRRLCWSKFCSTRDAWTTLGRRPRPTGATTECG